MFFLSCASVPTVAVGAGAPCPPEAAGVPPPDFETAGRFVVNASDASENFSPGDESDTRAVFPPDRSPMISAAIRITPTTEAATIN